MIDGSLTNFAHSGWSGGQSAEFDLGSIITITELHLWNRVDCCPGRMKNMWIFVSDAPISTNLSTARASGAASFNLPGEVGGPSTIGINDDGPYVGPSAVGQCFISPRSRSWPFNERGHQ